MNHSQENKKIVVIGAGNVGETIAYTLMLRKQANDIVLIDLNEKRAKGSALDLAHATGFFKQVNVRTGGYEECADAGIIIITAGLGRKPGQTRLDLAKTNVSIAKTITREIMKYAVDPIIIVVANPVDILTMAVTKESGLSPNRVIGTGTALDTARLRYLVSHKCGVNVNDLSAFILGEHGDSQVPIWSQVTIGGVSLADFIADSHIKLDYDKITKEAKDSGAKIIANKGATYNGVAMSTSRIVEAIIKNENAILPVSHLLDESYGDWSNIAFSLPCMVNAEGISRVIRMQMSEEEKTAMDNSAKVMHDFWEHVESEEEMNHTA